EGATYLLAYRDLAGTGVAGPVSRGTPARHRSGGGGHQAATGWSSSARARARKYSPTLTGLPTDAPYSAARRLISRFWSTETAKVSVLVSFFSGECIFLRAPMLRASCSPDVHNVTRGVHGCQYP